MQYFRKVPAEGNGRSFQEIFIPGVRVLSSSNAIKSYSLWGRSRFVLLEDRVTFDS